MIAINKESYTDIPFDLPKSFPPQKQDLQPGSQQQMYPKPITDNPNYVGSGKLKNKVAIITGGDSGIGQAVAAAFAKEGCDMVIPYYSEDEDAAETLKIVESYGQCCILFKCDLKDENASVLTVNKAISELGHIDIVVNNIAVQYPKASLSEISSQQLENTFQTNVLSYFHMTKAALPHLKSGASIINTTSVTAYKGSPYLIDYSATKGAIVSFTRSLALALAKDKIRVNAVAPGPVWTPLITATSDENQVQTFGQNVPLGRAAQPFELAPTYVYLASDDSAYVTGQVLHVNGGEIVDS